ncbi:MAG: hypothetical protein JWM40_2667 [Frankiales bacterium]|nr:hypothetical protein [Frankiales bacterium]
MKLRLLTAVTLAGALLLSISGAEAATPVMDGKKVKVLKLVGQGGLQSNDKDLVLTGGERVACQPPRCSKLTFVYKPAKGVAGGLMLTANWGNPLSDIDLYLGEVSKRGVVTQLGSCGGSASTSEKVYVGRSFLKAGKTYVMIVDYYRSINETVNAKVEINVPSTITNTLPAAVDALAFFNCTR